MVADWRIEVSMRMVVLTDDELQIIDEALYIVYSEESDSLLNFYGSTKETFFAEESIIQINLYTNVKNLIEKIGELK